jgi:uncharacterized BrkB/YihY/UPF0761 family membrane protein
VLQNLPLQAGPGQNLILDSVRGLAKESPGLTVIGLLGLLWSASGMFGAIRSALNIAWGAEPRHSLIRQRLGDMVSVFGLGLLLLLSMTASIALHLIQSFSLRFGGGGSCRSISCGSCSGSRCRRSSPTCRSCCSIATCRT